MSNNSPMRESVKAIETIIADKFRTEPFHNLHLLYDKVPNGLRLGGTCSDKTMSFIKTAAAAGYMASLHSGLIGGREIHRLARLVIEDSVFFADVGNGWPALKLYPASHEIQYSVFGMNFRTELCGSWIKVFHEKQGKETCQVEIDTQVRPKPEIEAEIETRFSSGIVYPFSNSLRFSQIVNGRFLFIRGDVLQIYSKEDYKTVDGITRSNLPIILKDYFGYNVTC